VPAAFGGIARTPRLRPACHRRNIQGRCAADACFAQGGAAHGGLADRIEAYALYIDPPLGRAGMTERQVRERNKPALIAKRPMTKVGRAVEKGETQGFMKILVDAGDKRILVASILAVGGDEIIHSLLDMMYANAPYTVMQRAMHIHPTVSELLPTILGEFEPLAMGESSRKPARRPRSGNRTAG
jgi:pyruvate/2-oxoglutarate dehydrogenase complex dihydrolipoamide dehydrogenase (E3) component